MGLAVFVWLGRGQGRGPLEPGLLHLVLQVEIRLRRERQGDAGELDGEPLDFVELPGRDALNDAG